MLWKDIEEYQGYYKITSSGLVMSIHTYNRMKPHIIRQTLGKRGYMVVSLSIKQHRKTIPVHRLVARTFINNPNGYPIVNHIDGNKLNNDMSNLEWCSYKYNAEHAMKMGLIKEYDHSKAPKLTKELAIEIFDLPGTHRSIADKYNIGISTVTHIKRGSRWGKYTDRHFQ
jgi:hypothetical protein